MRAMRILGFTVLVMVLVGLLLGLACTKKQGDSGVGIETIVNNGDGTFTMTLTDGSTFISDNLTGSQGLQGAKGDQGRQGDMGGQGSLTSDSGISWEWSDNQTAFLIQPDDLPNVSGAGLPDNRAVQIYLVVAPTSSTLVATVTTNSIGCFRCNLADLNEGRYPLAVAADANLDWTHSGHVGRACCFQAVADGVQLTTAPVYLYGQGVQTELQKANAELVTAQAAIESCLADANSAKYSTYGPWDGTRATSPSVTIPGPLTYYASDYLRRASFKATYTVTADGEILGATLTPAPGETAWVGIRWDSGTSRWVSI